MLKDKIDRFKKLISKKTEGNNKKNIENLVVFLILLIITIIAINSIWGADKKKDANDNNTDYKQLAQSMDGNINSNISQNDTYNLENNLKDILSKISGARESRCSNYIFRD